MKKTLRFAAAASGLVASLITVGASAPAHALRAQGAWLADEAVAVVNN
ncbi:peptidylprolyl isomerase, partial [Burkholderia pseudomallei]